MPLFINPSLMRYIKLISLALGPDRYIFNPAASMSDEDYLAGVLSRMDQFFGPWREDTLNWLGPEVADALRDLAPPENNRTPFRAVGAAYGLTSPFVDLICECMQLDPACRPTPGQILDQYSWLSD